MGIWVQLGVGGRVLVGLVGVLSAIATTVDNPLKSSVCRSVGVHAPASVVNIFCQFKDRPVQDAEARAFLDDFFGAASAAEPGRAYRMLGPESGIDRETFLQSWQPALWAEVLGRPRNEESFNVYAFELRKYSAFEHKGSSWSGEVETRPLRYRLERTDDGVRLHSITGDGNGPVQRTDFPRFTLDTASDTYRLPSEAAAVQLPAGRQRAFGGQLTGLCRTDAGTESWVRAKDGWLNSARLSDPSAALALPECDPRWVADLGEELTRPGYAASGRAPFRTT